MKSVSRNFEDFVKERQKFFEEILKNVKGRGTSEMSVKCLDFFWNNFGVILGKFRSPGSSPTDRSITKA